MATPSPRCAGASSSYRWPPSRAHPVTCAPAEDLIDLSDDYEYTSEGIRVDVAELTEPTAIRGPLVPHTPAAVVTTPTQRSVIRPIPRIRETPPTPVALPSGPPAWPGGHVQPTLGDALYKWVSFLLGAFFSVAYRHDRKWRRRGKLHTLGTAFHAVSM